jgi:hypothetical protein
MTTRGDADEQRLTVISFVAIDFSQDVFRPVRWRQSVQYILDFLKIRREFRESKRPSSGVLEVLSYFTYSRLSYESYKSY